MQVTEESASACVFMVPLHFQSPGLCYNPSIAHIGSCIRKPLVILRKIKLNSPFWDFPLPHLPAYLQRAESTKSFYPECHFIIDDLGRAVILKVTGRTQATLNNSCAASPTPIISVSLFPSGIVLWTRMSLRVFLSLFRILKTHLSVFHYKSFPYIIFDHTIFPQPTPPKSPPSTSCSLSEK